MMTNSIGGDEVSYKEYTVEAHTSLSNLVDGVNVLLDAGWVLQGGICHSIETTSWTNERKGYEETHTEELFMQAMIVSKDKN